MRWAVLFHAFFPTMMLCLIKVPKCVWVHCDGTPWDNEHDYFLLSVEVFRYSFRQQWILAVQSEDDLGLLVLPFLHPEISCIPNVCHYLSSVLLACNRAAFFFSQHFLLTNNTLYVLIWLIFQDQQLDILRVCCTSWVCSLVLRDVCWW